MKIIAHRGASGEFPENSLLAFEQAINQKSDGIELDIHFHINSQTFIVLHDGCLSETTNGHGHFDNYTLDELTCLELGQQQYLITLEDALIKIAGRCIVNLEIKSATTKKNLIAQQLNLLNEQLTRAVAKHNFTFQQLIISSFNHHIIAVCKTHIPFVQTAALIAHIPLNINYLYQELQCDYINQDIESIDNSLVESAHLLGLKVWVYTVDKKIKIEQCMSLKVDAIFTNFPKKSREIVKGL